MLGAPLHTTLPNVSNPAARQNRIADLKFDISNKICRCRYEMHQLIQVLPAKFVLHPIINPGLRYDGNDVDSLPGVHKS